MPTGVYYRSPNLKAEVRKNLAMGRSPESRKKATKKLRALAQTEEWRMRVSEGTRAALLRPGVKAKRLQACREAVRKHGLGFRGGNGQPLTPRTKRMLALLSKYGFVAEYPIRTKAVRALFPHVATVYKADFADPIRKVALELDGALHGLRMKATDEKKAKVLAALGWTVVRWDHYRRTIAVWPARSGPGGGPAVAPCCDTKN